MYVCSYLLWCSKWLQKRWRFLGASVSTHVGKQASWLGVLLLHARKLQTYSRISACTYMCVPVALCMYTCYASLPNCSGDKGVFGDASHRKIGITVKRLYFVGYIFRKLACKMWFAKVIFTILGLSIRGMARTADFRWINFVIEMKIAKSAKFTAREI